MQEPFRKWAILELMGHRQLAGLVSEVELFGAKMCQVDIPAVDSRPGFTQRYGGGAIYCVTECTEETARRVVVASGILSPDVAWSPPENRPQLLSRRVHCACGNEMGPDESACWECASEVISSPEHEATETNLEPPCEV